MFCRFVGAALLLVSLTAIAAVPHSPSEKPDEGYCARGEEYSKCGGCDPTCDNRNPVCTEECRVGCFCEKGLVRDSNKECVPPSECPKCPKGEKYLKCGGCDPTCDDRNPVRTEECKVGCFCEKGLVRNIENKCVPPSECPKCPEGERYAECSGCDKTCDNSNPKCPLVCKAGCVCEKGLVRDYKNQCVPSSKCPKCAEGEKYAECSGCDKTCSNSSIACPLICKPGCVCAEGNVRNYENKCIPSSKCPKCAEGEKYAECSGCDPTCDNSNPKCPLKCEAGCVCEKGLVRNYKNQCVPSSKCPKCAEGEEYSECGGCDPACDNREPVCTKECKIGCFCKKGLVRNGYKECVSPSKCPKCPEGEKYAECGGCDPTCDNSNPKCPLVCKAGCVCEKGLVRDYKNQCVPSSKCPKCAEGEKYAECSGCDKTCSNSSIACPLICKPGCVCAEGNVRNYENKCIPSSKCPKCAEGEKYAECSGCDPTCDNSNPKCPLKCEAGCVCEKGLVRNYKNQCVPSSKCPKCAEGEEYSECGGCDPACDNREPVCTKECKIGCFCKKGLVRNGYKECVQPSKCPKCPEGEKYAECGGCDPTCDNSNPKCPLVCKAGCVCEKGLVRDYKNQCVPSSKCPKCAEGEKYAECSGCDKTCSNSSIACPLICKPGCVCAEGNVRNYENKCIPSSKCPKCPEGEKYAECSGCDPTCDNSDPKCPRKCEAGCVCEKGLVRNYKNQCVPSSKCPKCAEGEEYSECGGCDPACDNREPVCTKECKIGCFCKKGLVRNGYKECVSPSKCPKCPEGEKYAKCSGCDKTCSNSNPICPLICKAGCVCEKGLVRNGYKECVSPSKCPKCPEGEKYAKCSGCDPTCDNSNPKCPLLCKAGCVCEKGLVRDYKNQCVPSSKCPKCPKGEKYAKCCGCDPTCDNSNPECPRKCEAGCVCEKGLVRNYKNECVSSSKCPKCPKGEKYAKCCGCDPTCDNSNPECPRTCEAGCVCDKGLVRNGNGECVSPSKCPKRHQPKDNY